MSAADVNKFNLVFPDWASLSNPPYTLKDYHFRDAFRHFSWSAWLSNLNSPEDARFWTNAHESVREDGSVDQVSREKVTQKFAPNPSDSDYARKYQAYKNWIEMNSKMDLNNNAKGIEFGQTLGLAFPNPALNQRFVDYMFGRDSSVMVILTNQTPNNLPQSSDSRSYCKEVYFKGKHPDTDVDGEHLETWCLIPLLEHPDFPKETSLDTDDGTLDGNQRLLIGSPDLPVEDTDANGYADGAYESDEHVVLLDSIDYTGQIRNAASAGQVDMRDFRRWRDWLLQVQGVTLSGSANHPKKDVNLDGTVGSQNEENIHPRGDFNGDGILSATASAIVPGGEDMTDLQVLQESFNDSIYSAAELPDLLQSGDIQIDPAECSRLPEGLSGLIFSKVQTTSGDTVTTIAETVHQDTYNTYGGSATTPRAYDRIYTLKPGTYTVSMYFYFGTIYQRYVGAIAKKTFTVTPGSDAYWRPDCNPRVRFDGNSVTNLSEDGYLAYVPIRTFYTSGYYPDGANLPHRRAYVLPGETIQLVALCGSWYIVTPAKPTHADPAAYVDIPCN